MTDRKIPVVSVVGTIALVLTVSLNTVVGLLLIQTRQAAAEYSRCTAEWQQEFGEVAKARGAALDNVIRAVADQDEAAFKRAIHQYERHPFPPLPETVCGKAK